MTSGPIGNVGSLGSGEQAGDDLRGKTIQPQIYQPESKGNLLCMQTEFR